MDELEPELRATLGRIADGPQPSDELVGKTLARSAQIRRRRNAVAASGVAATVLVLAFAVAAIAGADTHGAHFRVTGPAGIDDSTVAPTTTTAPLPTTTTTHRDTVVSAVPVTPTTAPECAPQAVIQDHPDEVLLDNGDIEVSYFFPFGPAREDHHYILDDGSTGGGGFTRDYRPDEFGPHWYDEWAQAGGTPENLASCKTRHTFVVDPSLVTPIIDPSSTTIPDTTTLPSDTTVPENTTTVP